MYSVVGTSLYLAGSNLGLPFLSNTGIFFMQAATTLGGFAALLYLRFSLRRRLTKSMRNAMHRMNPACVSPASSMSSSMSSSTREVQVPPATGGFDGGGASS